MTLGEVTQRGDGELADFLRRIQAGDEAAARELLSRFEAEVRLVVRRQLPRLLRSRFDSLDFLQSVWGSFFRRMRTSPTDFEDSRHLVAFLARAAKNKVIDEYRRAASRKQDMHREEPLWGEGLAPARGARPGRLAQRGGPGPGGARAAARADADGPPGDPGDEGRGPLQQGDRRAAGDQRAHRAACPGGPAGVGWRSEWGHPTMNVSASRRTWEEASSPAAVRLARGVRGGLARFERPQASPRSPGVPRRLAVIARRRRRPAGRAPRRPLAPLGGGRDRSGPAGISTGIPT